MRAKPFLKWAGGKTQLIEQIKNQIPSNIRNKNFTYIEPFVGSGAILFWLLEKYPNLERAVINDINSDLINTYLTIKNDVNKLIVILKNWEKEYHSKYNDKESAKKYYYEKRDLFNSRCSDNTTQGALFIFLNKTCFNGLYRVNSKNLFNVPIGKATSLPTICNKENLLAVSEVLKKVEILNKDYSATLKYATNNTLFYFDPPYKPLSDTSSFNSYTKDDFNDKEQIRLKEFCDNLDKLNHQWILSNSDLKGKNPNDNFFDNLYASFKIDRVNARRSISANGSKRGILTELLITN